MPAWVKLILDLLIEAAAIPRAACHVPPAGQITGASLTPQAVVVLRFCGQELRLKIQAHGVPRTCVKLCRSAVGELEQIQLLLATPPSLPPNATCDRNRISSIPQ